MMNEHSKVLIGNKEDGFDRVIPNGEAVAAHLAASLALLALSLMVLGCEASPSFQAMITKIGGIFIPVNGEMGAYPGKVILTLATWLITWFILHFSMQGHQYNGYFWLTISLLTVGIASTFIWPPTAKFLTSF